MLKPEFVFIWLSILVFGPQIQFCRADLGTASQYSSQINPTACYGDNPNRLPVDKYFAAAGESIWDNGAACDRQYFVQCISAVAPLICASNEIIKVRIVDRAQSSISRPAYNGTSIVLSDISFAAIANPESEFVNIQYIQF